MGMGGDSQNETFTDAAGFTPTAPPLGDPNLHIPTRSRRRPHSIKGIRNRGDAPSTAGVQISDTYLSSLHDAARSVSSMGRKRARDGYNVFSKEARASINNAGRRRRALTLLVEQLSDAHFLVSSNRTNNLRLEHIRTSLRQSLQTSFGLALMLDREMIKERKSGRWHDFQIEQERPSLRKKRSRYHTPIVIS